jgi:hypothetical protein
MRARLRIAALLMAVVLAGAIAVFVWWIQEPHEQGNEARTFGNGPRASGFGMEMPTGGARLKSANGEESASAALTPDEGSKIEAEIEAAKVLLREIEAREARLGKVVLSGNTRSQSLHIPPLTVQQLQPVYDALSRVSKGMTPGSAVAREFRRRADEFLKTLQERPGMYVHKSFDMFTGETRYGEIRLSEGATVKETAEGGIEIEGNSVAVVSATLRSERKREDLEYLFSRARMPVR